MTVLNLKGSGIMPQHIITMLKTLKEFEISQITLTFNDQSNKPVVKVAYISNSYRVTYIESQFVETYNDINSTLSAINSAINETLETSN
ncbi:hypothetical protein [Peribacillus frigoritolerans]|uniref:hypothetical protein n=1 Tax=Peribacillus frigoritolerans TaxID=450367 RepID=UPI003B8B8762